MSDLTSELNLVLAVDDDDTADYIVQTAGLRGSLITLDGMFSSSTGHSHNGAHQGGALSFQNLTIGGNLTVNGGATFAQAVVCQSALNVTGPSTLGQLTAGATIVGTLSAGSLTVSGSSTLNDIQAHSIYASGVIGAGPGGALTSVAGDLSANRGNNTGYVFLGSSSAYIGFDGTNYQMPSANLYVNGSRVVTETATQTLTNKTLNNCILAGSTLSSPTFSGAVTVNGTLATSGAVNIGGNTSMSGNLYVDDGVSGITLNLRNGNYAAWQKSNRSGASAGECTIANYVYVPGDVYAGLRMYAISFNQTSDPRLKSGMTVVSDDTCMDRVRATLPVQTYTMEMPPSDTPQPTLQEIGFSAPDVYASSPEFVTLDDTNTPVGLNYANMAALLWGALRQLDARCQTKGI